MFEQQKIIQSAFGITLPQVRGVGQREDEIYELLKGHYFSAKPFPGAEAPGALTFQSQHGHSQIIVTDTDLVLSVNYSVEWQTNKANARQYMIERAQMLFDVLALVSSSAPYFCGSIFQVRVPWSGGDEELVQNLSSTLLVNRLPSYHDVVVRITDVVDDTFFCNISTQNYRLWTSSLSIGNTLRLSRYQANERGADVSVDFNSRYAYNEQKPFVPSRENVPIVVAGGLSAAMSMADQLRGAHP